MSHFTKVSTKITDLTALDNALSSMGLQLKHNAPCRYYHGTQTRKNVCKLPGPYDVAFEENSDGTFSIDADFYQGHVAKAIGSNGAILMKSYAKEKLKIETRNKGYKIRELSNGHLKVYDPTDSSGAFLEAVIADDGSITFKAKGFSGKSCMTFASLEEALGDTSTKKTEDYYQNDIRVEVEYRKESW